jgi:hypothetical protein
MQGFLPAMGATQRQNRTEPVSNWRQRKAKSCKLPCVQPHVHTASKPLLNQFTPAKAAAMTTPQPSSDLLTRSKLEKRTRHRAPQDGLRRVPHQNDCAGRYSNGCDSPSMASSVTFMP